MDPMVVLITGCSSGIGLHLAVRLASDRSQGFKGIGREERSGGQGRVPGGKQNDESLSSPKF